MAACDALDARQQQPRYGTLRCRRRESSTASGPDSQLISLTAIEFRIPVAKIDWSMFETSSPHPGSSFMFGTCIKVE